MKEELFEDFGGTFSDEAELIQLVGLKLGDEEYAIDVLKIQEIIRSVEITVVPRMENYILGVMNLRGKVIPVVDLRVRFSLEKSDFDKATRIIVVRFDKQNIGFVVDEVTEVIRVKKTMVEPTPPLVGSIGQEYILGICRYDTRLIMLLDIDRVVGEGGDKIESELRKKMLGASNKNSTYENMTPLPQAEETKPASEATADKVANADLPAPDAVPAPIISVAEDATPTSQSGADASVEDNIDALIAKELAMREAETDELNKKKRSMPKQEDVLNDALKQSAAIFEQDADSQVEQNDLDTLIAKELAIREAETDELNKKNRDSKKKNDDTRVDITVVDPNAVPPLEIISFDDKGDVASISEMLREETKAIEAKDSVSISIKELKTIVDKIIAGEHPVELDMDIKGEIGELLRLIIDTKTKVDDIAPTLETSSTALPNMASVLEDVNKSTEKAALNLMDASNDISVFYKNLIEDVSSLQNLAKAGNEADFQSFYDLVLEKLSKAENLGFKILESLEFQDITEQKLRKVIKSVEEIGSRIGTIVGYLKVKNPDVEDKNMDKLLSDYGLM